MKSVQFIQKESSAFRLRIEEKEFTLIKANLYCEDDLLPLIPKVKGSTLGWYVMGGFVSYNQIAKVVRKNINNECFVITRKSE